MDIESRHTPFEVVEQPNTYIETAQLMRHLSYLIVNNNWFTRGKDEMKLVYTYPLHKPQILEYIKSMSGREFREFHDEVAYDDEFRSTLVSTVENAASIAIHEDDIMAQNPNITPVIIVTNPEQPKSMRVGGAFLLLEAQDSVTGEKVLVIRGNNPLETVIGKLDPQDFVRQVIAYTKEIADKRNISKVAIPLDGRGQSATNRQSIFDSYQLLYGSNFKISLSGNIVFNGYNLANRCVIV